MCGPGFSIWPDQQSGSLYPWISWMMQVVAPCSLADNVDSNSVNNPKPPLYNPTRHLKTSTCLHSPPEKIHLYLTHKSNSFNPCTLDKLRKLNPVQNLAPKNCIKFRRNSCFCLEIMNPLDDISNVFKLFVFSVVMDAILLVKKSWNPFDTVKFVCVWAKI
jgi:hypothetical protein